MPKKTDFTVTRIPSDDWNNLMETVTLDGTYSEEIKNDVWMALENMEDFSEPWIVVKFKEGKVEAKIFPSEKSANKHVEKSTGQIFLVKGAYQNSKN